MNKILIADDNQQITSILANYAVANSNGDGTFTVTVYALDMTDL